MISLSLSPFFYYKQAKSLDDGYYIILQSASVDYNINQLDSRERIQAKHSRAER